MGRQLYYDIADRLFANSYDYEGHWLWLGAMTRDGYAKINLWVPAEKKVKTFYAHRVSYTVFVGSIPEGYDADHKFTCPYRHCIHPNCLRPRPYKEHRLQTAFRRKNPPKSLPAPL